MTSELQKERLLYQPKLPKIFQSDIENIEIIIKERTESLSHQEEIGKVFSRTYGMPVVTFSEGVGKAPHKMKAGVILSGGQAPGGHNVISGIYDAIKKMDKGSKLIGFLGGPSGILEDKSIVISGELIDTYRNTGGFDIIGSGRAKIEGKENFKKVLKTASNHCLDALFIIGGDDSNTNSAVLADFFKEQGSPISVIGVPKTIDGDLKNEYIEVSFGFDTACKTYCELIGNIARDAVSARKYWHFIRLMGRTASHITLECALQTHPNMALISEEVEQKGYTLKNIIEIITEVVIERYRKGFSYGIVLIPEGLIEFIPEMRILIFEINNLITRYRIEFNEFDSFGKKIERLRDKLSNITRSVFDSLPMDIQIQLIMDRDPHGNVQVSRIETEKLLILMVEELVKDQYSDINFNAMGHFFGYEGRCAFPSNFDSDYCYSLGFNAAVLAHFGLSGYISNIKCLDKSSDEWIAGGVPLTMMMNMEQRHGQLKPVIKKALVNLDGKPFQYFSSKRKEWAIGDEFVYPGAIQYYGPSAVCDSSSKTLSLELSK